jgi:regulator of RNase E activity RraA
MGTDELTARLAKLDTCAVSDALDRLGLAGTVTGIRPLSLPVRIAGRVVTVRLKPKEDEVSTRHLGTAAIVAATPGDVIVIDHQGRGDAAGWGGILSTAAKVRGVAGVVVDGACRDIDESRDVGFPSSVARPCRSPRVAVPSRRRPTSRSAWAASRSRPATW